MSDRVAPGCPLCEAPLPEVAVETVDPERIFLGLARELGVEYGRADRVRWLGAGPVRLYRCPRCGLAYFTPRCAGDDAFYGPLVASPTYYSEKWEHGWVHSRIADGARVLDVGCGRGAFLSPLRARATTTGIELDAGAAAAAAARGIEVLREPVAALAARAARRFDVVTSFHVLEHVEDPLAFARGLAALVRPGGDLYLATPNDARTWRNDFEPLEYPPHHLTRWSSSSLRFLGRRLGATWVEEAFEPLSWDTARYALEKRIARRIGGAVGAAAGFALARLAVPNRYGYDGLRAAERLALRGLGIVVRMRIEGGA